MVNLQNLQNSQNGIYKFLSTCANRQTAKLIESDAYPYFVKVIVDHVSNNIPLMYAYVFCRNSCNYLRYM